MKHKYAVFDSCSFEIYGTNSDEDAINCANCDDCLVVNMEEGKELTPSGELVELKQVTEIERD